MSVLKRIRSALAAPLLVLAILAFLGSSLWIIGTTVPWLAVVGGGWIAILTGAWAADQAKRRRHENKIWGNYDRRQTEALARQLRELEPESAVAALVLDHKPAYERREDVQ
jgi:hypothetical protein